MNSFQISVPTTYHECTIEHIVDCDNGPHLSIWTGTDSFLKCLQEHLCQKFGILENLVISEKNNIYILLMLLHVWKFMHKKTVTLH